MCCTTRSAILACVAGAQISCNHASNFAAFMNALHPSEYNTSGINPGPAKCINAVAHAAVSFFASV